MTRDREVKQTVQGLVEILRPSYTDEEQIHAKQMQKGYTVLKDLMQAQGRVIVTVHGSPEAVILRYQDLKLLWKFVNNLMDRVEDNTLAALAIDRLGNQREERVPLEQGLAEMREMIHDSHE